MKHHRILRVVAKLLIPAILLFGLYVQFHGDFGPGGGFQAGVIFAAGFILYGLVYGLEPVQRVAPQSVVTVLVAAGVLLYAGVGVASLLMGGTYLNYSVLAHDPLHGQHYGILLIEFGVGTTVAAVMLSIFYAFAGRGAGEPEDGDEKDDQDETAQMAEVVGDLSPRERQREPGR